MNLIFYYYYCPTGKKNGCDGSNMVKETDLIKCVMPENFDKIKVNTRKGVEVEYLRTTKTA